MTLTELNACDRQQFVDAIGWVFEHSAWVADAVWEQRPFATVAALHTAMRVAVAATTHERQKTLLRAHPDLGSRVQMSDASTGEQAGAGLDRLLPEEFERLQRLNQAYRDRFGFPFLFAVKGASKHDILAALERRGAALPEDEFAEALRQVYRIAEFRLHDLLGA